MCSPRRRWTWSATATPGRGNAIPKQTLDDQEKLVLQDEGTVKNDQGTVQYDQVQVGYCHITAPIAGRVGLRLVDPGNVVQAGGTTTLAVITQLQPITVIFTIPEDSLGRCSRGAHAQASSGGRLRPHRPEEDCERQAADARQPDRHHHRHGQTARRSSTTRMARSFPTSSSTRGCW
jgi:hypothetical protein